MTAVETTPAAVPVLETRGLTRAFGGFVATEDVSLALAAGARHALIGPNGAGKTTLINLLTGVLAPSRGRVLLDGTDITGLRRHVRVRRGHGSRHHGSCQSQVYFADALCYCLQSSCEYHLDVR